MSSQKNNLRNTFCFCFFTKELKTEMVQENVCNLVLTSSIVAALHAYATVEVFCMFVCFFFFLSPSEHVLPPLENGEHFLVECQCTGPRRMDNNARGQCGNCRVVFIA